MKALLAILLLVAGLAVFWYAQNVEKSMPVTTVNATATGSAGSSGSTGNDALSQAVGLALKGIELVQGEKGFEHMRLKASWAAMSQDNNKIDVLKPVLRYALEKKTETDSEDTDENVAPEKYIDVMADKGLITDKQKKITLQDNVVAIYEGYTLRSKRMEYDSTDRIMLFPQQASLEGPKFSGTAGQVLWNIPKGVIEAEHGVSVVWNGSPLHPVKAKKK